MIRDLASIAGATRNSQAHFRQPLMQSKGVGTYEFTSNFRALTALAPIGNYSALSKVEGKSLLSG
jgi:hypothetical protein